ncbi:LLM class oxidoreductase [Ilumatobacter coccineus]|uniref:Putative oxidoreductase n=1 Tax=Ilumatobacter coccineus (strain NBRC 103263 / KCTC 29153 / YM16-304) TaxID=1313172 RepID=A0A6C7E6U1_ILUCY|nr:LLM class oxidoreductase [Ilumatobacter coccineus]BAN00895.1 putative oxidoreductase [Ilumatobacter coccineus YM16-304]
MTHHDTHFAPINRGYDSVFRPGRLSVGLVAPIENHHGPIPTMDRHLERVRLAEELGFAAVWLRDVPFNVDSFGDAGQLHDPFVYLGLLAGATERIALGTASIVLPLRHPAHVAKAAASADVLSGGRVILGVASGDRPDEFPAMNVPFEERGERFRESFEYLTRMADERPRFTNSFGTTNTAIDLLPKPTGGRLPLMITGSSRQTPEWVARHGDGWMTYPRANAVQTSHAIDQYRDAVDAAGRDMQPVMQPLYIDLADDPSERMRPIHLGYRLGVDRLGEHLRSLEAAGVNHVALNLRFNTSPVEPTLETLANHLLPDFTHQGALTCQPS